MIRKCNTGRSTQNVSDFKSGVEVSEFTTNIDNIQICPEDQIQYESPNKEIQKNIAKIKQCKVETQNLVISMSSKIFGQEQIIEQLYLALERGKIKERKFKNLYHEELLICKKHEETIERLERRVQQVDKKNACLESESSKIIEQCIEMEKKYRSKLFQLEDKIQKSVYLRSSEHLTGENSSEGEDSDGKDQQSTIF